MRASEMSPEQRAAHYERLRATLDSVDTTLADAETRAVERQALGLDLDEWPREEPPRLPAPAPARQRATPAPPVAWATQKWVRERIGNALEQFAELLGEEVARTQKEERAIAGRRIEELERRLERSEQATTSLLMEMEAAVTALKERVPPTRPRLIGGSDAA